MNCERQRFTNMKSMINTTLRVPICLFTTFIMSVNVSTVALHSCIFALIFFVISSILFICPSCIPTNVVLRQHISWTEPHSIFIIQVQHNALLLYFSIFFDLKPELMINYNLSELLLYIFKVREVSWFS